MCLEGGRQLHILFKSVGPDDLLRQAPLARLDDPYDPACEARTYTTVLGEELGTPACFGAEVDSQHNRYWIFLERVEGIELSDVGEVALWEEVARWLARFHDRFYGADRLPEGFARYGHVHYQLGLSRAAGRAFGSPHRLSTYRQAVLREITNGCSSLIEHLVARPVTIIHGEFYPQNILVVPSTDRQVRVCPVDWGTTAVGPGVFDLAALTSGEWGDDDRLKFARAYWKELSSREEDWETLLRSLHICRIYLLIQWIGAVAEDSSGPSRIDMWIDEARRLCAQL